MTLPTNWPTALVVSALGLVATGAGGVAVAAYQQSDVTARVVVLETNSQATKAAQAREDQYRSDEAQWRQELVGTLHQMQSSLDRLESKGRKP